MGRRYVLVWSKLHEQPAGRVPVRTETCGIRHLFRVERIALFIGSLARFDPLH
jgi:hypothetical protein